MTEPTDVQPNDSAPDRNDQVSAEVKAPDFAPLDRGSGSGTQIPLNRFYDVDVTLWVELGRVSLPLRRLLELGEGAVVELSRSVSEPVDIVAQGVRVAKGEVVVVDDSFAVRIKELESSKAAA